MKAIAIELATLHSATKLQLNGLLVADQKRKLILVMPRRDTADSYLIQRVVARNFPKTFAEIRSYFSSPVEIAADFGMLISPSITDCQHASSRGIPALLFGVNRNHTLITYPPKVFPVADWRAVANITPDILALLS